MFDSQVYPSGGEDVALFMKWLQTSELLKDGGRDVYFLGNSAGGSHVTTFLFDQTFLEERKQYVHAGQGYLEGARELVAGRTGISLKGVVL